MSETIHPGNREYLGDSVYAGFDGSGIILTTENGYGASNLIYLETNTLVALQKYMAKMYKSPDPQPGSDVVDRQRDTA